MENIDWLKETSSALIWILGISSLLSSFMVIENFVDRRNMKRNALPRQTRDTVELLFSRIEEMERHIEADKESIQAFRARQNRFDRTMDENFHLSFKSHWVMLDQLSKIYENDDIVKVRDELQKHIFSNWKGEL